VNTRYFNYSEDVIRWAILLYVRYPLSLRQVEELMAERGVDVSYETIRLWWNRFGPEIARTLRKRRQASSRWAWHLDEVFVRINGKHRYLWRAVDHEGEVLDCVVTDKLLSYPAALRELRFSGDHCTEK
jgi:putative transposase